MLESLDNNASKEFAHDTEQGDATVVVTVASVSFVLVEGDNVVMSYVLGYLAFPPAQV